ncbi:MAG: type II toxin-antitoxin system RelE/ParE family toxin [Candidatus Acidiferrales bacterium]
MARAVRLWRVMRYRVSEDAQRDLDEIYLYWGSRVSLKRADRVIDRITERFWLLGEHPNEGNPAGYTARGVKCFAGGKYLIYYRKAHGGSDILHIFHGAGSQASASRAARKRRRLTT